MPKKSTKPKAAKKTARSRSLARSVTGTIKHKVATHRSLTPHRSFRMTHKHLRPRPASIVSSRKLLGETLRILREHWRVFGMLAFIMLALTWAFIGVIPQDDYLGLKDATRDLVGNNTWQGSLLILQSLFDGTLTPTISASQQVMQFVGIVIAILCVVWLTRNLQAGNQVSVRQALYNAPTPFVSLLLVFVVLLLQMLPAAIGVYIFSIAVQQGFMEPAIVGTIITMLMLLLVTLSLYLSVTTIIALIIVTIPGTYPLVAITSAKQLVIGRRLRVLLRILGLVVWLLVLWALALLPFIVIDNLYNVEAIAYIPIALPLLGIVSLMIGTIYLYRLYRNLL